MCIQQFSLAELNEAPSSEAVGGGAHLGIAVQMPWNPGALRQEDILLSGHVH